MRRVKGRMCRVIRAHSHAKGGLILIRGYAYVPRWVSIST